MKSYTKQKSNWIPALSVGMHVWMCSASEHDRISPRWPRQRASIEGGVSETGKRVGGKRTKKIYIFQVFEFLPRWDKSQAVSRASLLRGYTSDATHQIWHSDRKAYRAHTHTHTHSHIHIHMNIHRHSALTCDVWRAFDAFHVKKAYVA